MESLVSACMRERMWHDEKKKGHSCWCICGHNCCASLHSAMHGDTIYVQQDIRLCYHWGNNDHYLPHCGSNSSTEASQNGSKCKANTASWRYRESSGVVASQQWRCVVFLEQDIRAVWIHQSTYFQLLESRLPPTHARKCMFYISPRWNVKTKGTLAHSCLQAHKDTHTHTHLSVISY